MPRHYLRTSRGVLPQATLTGRRLALALEKELERPTFVELIREQDRKLQQLKEQMFGGVGMAHVRLQVVQAVPLSAIIDPTSNGALAISTHYNDHRQAMVETDRPGEDADIDFSRAEDFLQLETPIDARRDHNILKLGYTIPSCMFMTRLLRKYPVNKKRLAFIQRRPLLAKMSHQGMNGVNRKGDGKEVAVSCQVCGQRFTRQHLFQSHILTHPDPENKIFLCQICGKRFNRADHLNRHSLLHQVSVFKCQQCGEEFDRASHLDRHRRKNHPLAGHVPAQTPPQTPQGKIPSGNTGPLTPSSDQQPSGSNLHLLASVATPESSSAELCSVSEETVQFLSQMESEEQELQSVPVQPDAEKREPDRPFMCNVCNHRFIRATHLRRHMRIHTGEKPFTCHICGQRYARGDYLRAHIQAHRRDRIHKCKHCGEAFHDLTRFADHCRVRHRDVNDEFGNPCPPPEYSPPPPTPSITLAIEAAEEITIIPMTEVSEQHPQLLPNPAPSALYHPITIQTAPNQATPTFTSSPPQPDMIQMTLVNIPDPSPSPDVIITSHIPASLNYSGAGDGVVSMSTLGGHMQNGGGQIQIISNGGQELGLPKPLPPLYDANDPILQYIITNGNTNNGQSQRLHH